MSDFREALRVLRDRGVQIERINEVSGQINVRVNGHLYTYYAKTGTILVHRTGSPAKRWSSPAVDAEDFLNLVTVIEERRHDP
ncbi:MAG: hypothetical protein ACI4SY_05970 [Sutterella sp.]